MRKFILSSLLTFFFSILVGCSTGKDARALAQVTLSQTITYEDEIDAKITAEKTYYQESINTLVSSMERTSAIDQLRTITDKAQSITNKTIKSQKDLDATDLKDYVHALLEDLRTAKLKSSLEHKELQQDLLNTLAQLENKKSSIKQIRRGLEKLQAEPSDIEQFKTWFDFFKDVKKTIDETNSSSNSTPET